jgi:hypothetical protein
MRRFLLTLSIITTFGWSQPAQQQGQPPLVVKVEMPSTNPWLRVVELVVPVIFGAGLALFGVWLTNKNNAATNLANRQHQLAVERIKAEIAARYKSYDNQWAFRKDIYVNVIKATSDLIQFFVVLAGQQDRDTLADDSLSDANKEALDKRRMNQALRAEGAAYEFITHTNLAHLAMADGMIEVIRRLQEEVFSEIDHASPQCKAQITAKKVVLEGLLQQLCSAGRAELWGDQNPSQPGNTVTQ